MSDPLPISENPNFERLRDIIQSGHCVLFLGAGVSMDSGAPSGPQLAHELSKSYFPSEPPYQDLGLVAEAIDASAGRRDLNSWLIQRFQGLTPQGALLSIPTYHWKSIYTVNFDELLEAAYKQVPNARQQLHPFYSSKDQMEGLGPDEVRYYKLHGSLSRANSDDGRLVLSADDMLGIGESRQRFLYRLYDDLHEYTLFYVGFGRLDLDFRQIIAMVEKAASNPQDLRRSYALQPSLTPSQIITWEKKRVTLIGAKAAPFFDELSTALPDWARYAPEDPPTAPPVSSFTQRFPQITPQLMLDVARNYEIIDERIKALEPNTEEFFVGAQPNWGLIASGADAKRDLSDEIMDVVLKDEHLDRGDVQCVLIHAEAGSGKTTLLRRIGVDLALSWHRIVVSLKSIGRIEFVPLERLAQATKKRIYLLIDDATDSARDLSKLLNNAKNAKTKLTVITNARSNEWRDASSDFNLEGIEEFELKPLSRREIDGILVTLADHNALGHLNEVSYEAQVAAFEKAADKQLLVALREATVGKNFDEIIEDEFDNIPSPDGQKAYLLVAALHRFGIPTRAGLLHRALHLPLKDVGRKVLDPTTKIIIVQQPIGDEDIYYTTRHPVIADIVFDRKLTNERRRREYYEELVTNLDLGYSSDLNAYHKLARGKNKQLLRDFKYADDRRSIMNLLIKRNPNDPYVHQHAAMLEISEQNVPRAGQHLERALDLAPNESSIRDTKGRFVLMSAIKESNSFLAEQKFAEAEQIFKNNAHNQPDEPYAYKHLAETYLEWAKRQANDDARMNRITLAYDTINEGLAKCSSTSMLLQKQAEIEQDMLKHPDAARKIFAKILEQRPGDTASRFLAATLEEQQGHPEAALAVLLAGVDSAQNDHHLRYRIARLMAEHDAGSDSEIRGHFDAAMLGSIRNVVPRVAYAAYLFSQGDYQAANKRFAELDRVPATKHERNRSYTFNFANIRDRVDGRITSLNHSSGRVEVNQGETEVFFSPLNAKAAVRANLSVGTHVSFNLAFNMKGPIAIGLALCEVQANSKPQKTVQLSLLQ